MMITRYDIYPSLNHAWIHYLKSSLLGFIFCATLLGEGSFRQNHPFLKINQSHAKASRLGHPLSFEDDQSLSSFF